MYAHADVFGRASSLAIEWSHPSIITVAAYVGILFPIVVLRLAFVWGIIA